VTLRASPQSGLAQGSGNNTLSGNFTATDLIGPLEGKSIGDFVKAISDGKIIAYRHRPSYLVKFTARSM